MSNPIALKTNDRILIVGKTGSGKTYLSRYLTRSVQRLIVLDAKATLKEWDLEPWSNETRNKLRSGAPVRIRVTPPYNGDVGGTWAAVLQDCYTSGNCTVYIDELYAIAPPGKNPLPILWSLYTRGRELGIGVWSSSQRPTWIPLFALSEAEQFFCFRLQLEDDRKRMSAFMGEEVLNPIPDPHGFYYSRAEWEKPEYHNQYVASAEEPVREAPTVEIPVSARPRKRKLFNKKEVVIQ